MPLGLFNKYIFVTRHVFLCSVKHLQHRTIHLNTRQICFPFTINVFGTFRFHFSSITVTQGFETHPKFKTWVSITQENGLISTKLEKKIKIYSRKNFTCLTINQIDMPSVWMAEWKLQSFEFWPMQKLLHQKLKSDATKGKQLIFDLHFSRQRKHMTFLNNVKNMFT